MAYELVYPIIAVCGRMEVGKNKETHEEHDEDCVEEEFQLTRGKFDRVGEGGREAAGKRYCSINV